MTRITGMLGLTLVKFMVLGKLRIEVVLVT